MRKCHSNSIGSILASVALIFHPMPVQASPATVSFAGLTVTAGTGGPNSVVSGSGTFADPWIFSGPGSIPGELLFSGASVVSCETPVAYPSSEFTRYSFSANDVNCGFQIITPGSIFGLRVSVQNASQVLYVSKLGSTPTVTSVGTSFSGRAVQLALSSSVGNGLGGPVSDFAVAVNGEAVPIQSIVRRGTQLDLELGLFQIGRTSTVTVAKVGSSFNYGTAPNVLANFSARSVTNNSTATIVNQSSAGAAGSVTPAAPIKYSGPEFSGLSLKPALSGTATTLEGRKLDQISSVTIGGKAAVLSNATDKSVNIGLPAELAPGVYDLVVTTANHGKLTHMNAIRIREELPATSLTIKGTGVLSGEEFKKLTAFARTQNPDMNTITCIVNSGSEGKSFTQARALCDRIAAANLNIKTTQFETRSTVKSSAVYARVVFSSVQ